MVFYQLAIRLYAIVVRVAALFNQKAKQWVEGRANWREELRSWDLKQPTYWFHTASLGEYEQAKPIIEQLKKRTDLSIVVSFYSPSGYEVRKNDSLPDKVCYMPLDTRKSAEDFLSIIKPVVAVFVRYEFWPNFMDVLYERNIPTSVVSAHFRNDQFMFKPLGSFIKKRLLHLNHILVQYPQSADVLSAHQFPSEKIGICGDSRIDQVLHISASTFQDEKIASFVNHQKTLILGSSYTDEESFTFPLMEKEKDLKIIIAPHYVDDANVSRIANSLPVKSIRYSHATAEVDLSPYQVLILDTMGMLSSVYKYGDYALVGGGFKDGIHSILEPAAHGLPLFFGPHHHSFPEAKGLMEVGAGFEIKDQASFIAAFLPIYQNTHLQEEIKEKTQAFMQQHSGASKKIADVLIGLYKKQ